MFIQSVEFHVTDVKNLPQQCGDVLTSVLEGESAKYDINVLSHEECVKRRSKIQTQKAALQGESNLLAKRIKDFEHFKKRETMNAEQLARSDRELDKRWEEQRTMGFDSTNQGFWQH